MKNTFLLTIVVLLTGTSLFANNDQNAKNEKNGSAANFPSIYSTDNIKALVKEENSKAFWVASSEETTGTKKVIPVEKKEKTTDKIAAAKLDNASALMDNSDILAFYGHPLSKNMGILGRMPKEELLVQLDVLADEYRAESGGKDIVKAFYIIYGTCWPEGEIGKIRSSVLQEYIDFALENNMLIFLDHQIGKYDPVESLASMFQYLKYPNVHLALDPEWRTTKPMQEFGRVTGGEINNAQQAMQDYINANNITGERMLVIHQFRDVMIKDRDVINADYQKVRLIHCMDGVGTPKEKLDTYKFNARATNMPIKAFKLFYDFKLEKVLVDTPLLTPKEVYALNPRPSLIMYQ
jgi:hypothetical protein